MTSPTIRLKHLADLYVSSIDKKSHSDEVPVRLVNYTDVYRGGRIVSELDLMRATATPSEIRAFRLAPGDVVITKDSETADDIGIAAYVERSEPDVVCGYHLAICRPKPAYVDGKFLFWALSSDEIRGQFSSGATGVTRYGLRTVVLGDVSLVVPSLPEQRVIADFLDNEINRIDTLIDKKRQMANLLETRLTSLAAEITGGQGGARKTCIATIPEVPLFWGVLRNKVFVREVNRRSSDGSEELLSVSHITGVTPRSEKMVYMFKAESTVGYKIVHPGDLVINTMWAWMGAAGVARTSGIVSPAYGVYSIDKNVMLPEFFDILVRTPAYVTEMTRFSRGVTSSRLRLYPDEFLRLSSPVPPIEEQREIAARYRAHSSNTRAVCDRLARQIDLLGERRQALITAAVTGELDISGAAA